MMNRRAEGGGLVTLILLASLAGPPGCRPPSLGEPVELTIPAGATFSEVADTMRSRGLVSRVFFFRVYARLRGDDGNIRAGRYSLRPGTSWSEILDVLVEGRVLTVPVTVPEGLTLPLIAERLAEITELSPDTVRERLVHGFTADELGVPGPGLEGYLFPDTYRFTPGVPLDKVVRTLVERYRAFWTPERRSRLQGMGLSEREVVTLASIVQAEARLTEEMPLIAAVYHNRLRLGWLLQADPTVVYALGGHRERLLFAAIDSVADHPYNTYSRPGLPPGPIGAPGEAALEAALNPAETDFLYFVAQPDGSHAFSRTLAEHNRARARILRETQGPG